MIYIGLISKSKNYEFIKKLNMYEEIKAINIKSEKDIIDKEIDILILEDLIFSREFIQRIIKNVKYLIIQDNINDIKMNLEKEINIITFGFNHKSTVTISSVTEENILICFQRIIKNINNKNIQPMESIIKNTNKYNINKHIVKKIIQEILDK